jgi:hypothetical protein
MGTKTNAYTVLVGKLEGNSPPATPRNRWEILKWILNYRFRDLRQSMVMNRGVAHNVEKT